MLGNLEVLLREKLGITVVHISNGGFAGYGPGFWGPGHDPFTHRVLGPDEVDMSKVIGALGFHTERVSEPAEIIPALRRALDVNTSGRPAYIEFICCQYPVYGQWFTISLLLLDDVDHYIPVEPPAEDTFDRFTRRA
jgi:thiamine pyrophosphate-dependent acetolactate synthase large subunit-like protein